MSDFARPYASFAPQDMATSSQQFYDSRPPFIEHNPHTNSYNSGWRDHPSFQWGGGGYATPYHAFQDQQEYAPPYQDPDPYQMRLNSSCAQSPDLYGYQEASQFEPHPPPYGYEHNFYDHPEPLQSCVPTHMEQNDFFHAQMPNEYASPSPDSPSSSTNDLMMQMCAFLMDRMERLDSIVDQRAKQQEAINSFASQWMNTKA